MFLELSLTILNISFCESTVIYDRFIMLLNIFLFFLLLHRIVICMQNIQIRNAYL